MIRSHWKRLLIALTAVSAATLLKLLLVIVLPGEYPFLIYYMSIVIGAWIGGIVPGLMATVLAAGFANYFFVEPRFAFSTDVQDIVQLAIFCAEGALLSVFSYQLHRAYDRAIEENVRHEMTEQSLRESEERFRLLVEGVKDYAIYMLNPEGLIASWNSGAEGIKGYTADEIIGKSWLTLHPPEEVQKGTPQRLMETAIREGSAQTEGWRVRKDGARFWAHVTLTALHQQGELRGFAKVTRDMTEHRRSEELSKTLERERLARVEAEHANALKTQFLAMISHELRTPLTSVKGFTTSLLAEDVNWTVQQQRQFVQVIDEEADKLKELIEQLLNLSQIQAGILQIRTKAQPFATSLDLAGEQLKTLAKEHRFEVELPDHLPNVIMDERRIAQVIVNIVSNATKYAPAGTPIVLTATVSEDMLQAAIHDEGHGIPADRRESIFEAFSQLELRANPQDGVGLGLAISKGLINAQGGEIWVRDSSPTGTTIVFTLPLENNLQH